jgi:hypothetical protein
MEAWQAKGLTTESRLFLVALADIVTETPAEGVVEINFSALMVLDDRLEWTSEEVDHYARPALGLDDDDPMGAASGMSFVWAEAIERVKAAQS